MAEEKISEDYQDMNETVKEDPPEEKEQQKITPDETEKGKSTKKGFKAFKLPLLLQRWKSSSLQELDKKHGWLSELEEKRQTIETSFISKAKYVAISNHCQKYLEDLKQSEELSSNVPAVQFQTEYSNLFDKFRTAFTGSYRFQQKVSEIKAYKNTTEAENRKLEIKLEDKNREIEDLQYILDTLQRDFLRVEKEKATLETLFNNLKTNADNNREQEQVIQKKPVVQDEEKEAQDKIKDLEMRLELLVKELEFTKQRETVYQNKIKQIEDIKSTLQKELNSVKYELQKQTTRAEKAEEKASENSEELKSKNTAIKNIIDDAEKGKLNLEKAKEESRRYFQELKKCQKELDGTTQLIGKLRKTIEIRDDRINILVTQKDSALVDMKIKQDEISSLKVDVENVTKEKKSLSRRVALLEQRITDVEAKLENAKKENFAQQKELDLIRKELEEAESKTKELTKQKDTLTEEVLKDEQTITRIQNETKVVIEKSRNLEKGLEKSQLVINGLQDNIKGLEKAKQSSAKENSQLKTNISNLQYEIKRLQLIITKTKEIEEKLKQQVDDEQEKNKRIAEDERYYKKLLIESRHEVDQLRDQQGMLKKYIEQLQGCNQDLDERGKKLDLNIKKLKGNLGDVKESYKQEVKNREELDAQVKHQYEQEQLLLKNLADITDVVEVQKRKIKNLLEEKNVLKSKLIEKEGEMNDLKENARLLQQEITALDKAMNDRINDIGLLKLHIELSNRNNALMSEQVNFMDSTRQELHDTHNKLMKEKVKSKALENEIQNPVNLHRWRILEGIDPEKGQLISKSQELQKQLIKRNKELDDKDIELEQKEKFIQELQEQLGRRSETNIQEQLWACKKELSSRMERVKCLTFENQMYIDLCNKYEQNNMALKKQLDDLKMKEYRDKFKARNAK